MKQKLFIIGLLVFVTVAVDQVTKLWAESVLANPHYPDHTVELTVDDDDGGKTLTELLDEELTWTSDAHRAIIAGQGESPGFALRGAQRLAPESIVEAGETLELQYKTVTIVDGYWDHHYARNEGAAFSFLADAPEGFRRIFFLLMPLLAVVGMLWFAMRTPASQRTLIVALGLVLGGALGNYIDRVAYGYVIDFIAWHVGDAYWPTFNLADVWVAVGVGLMALSLLFGAVDEEDDDDDDEATDEATAKVTAETDEVTETPTRSTDVS